MLLFKVEFDLQYEREQGKLPKGIPAGGIKISVFGKNLAYIENPQIYAYYEDKMFIGQCSVLSNSNMACDSPTIMLRDGNVIDAEYPLRLEFSFKMDDVSRCQQPHNKI